MKPLIWNEEPTSDPLILLDDFGGIWARLHGISSKDLLKCDDCGRQKEFCWRQTEARTTQQARVERYICTECVWIWEMDTKSKMSNCEELIDAR